MQKTIESELEVSVKKTGTDLYVQGRKINVAIATSSNNSTKIHFGINLASTGIPEYVQAIGLSEIKKDLDFEKFAITIAEIFKDEIKAINTDVMKSRTF